MADCLISTFLRALLLALSSALSPKYLPRTPESLGPQLFSKNPHRSGQPSTMASICAACSRNLLSRPTIPSSSRLPTSLPRLARPRQFSTLLAPCFKRRVSRFDAKSYRLATTSAFNSSRSGLPDLPPVPSRPNIKVSAPSLAAIREEGFYDDDVKLLPPEEAFLNITPEAIQVSSTRNLLIKYL